MTTNTEITTITEKKPLFYTFGQNNSGGGFDVNDEVAHHVIIEAYSAEEANAKAQSLGIYFHGCDIGRDCPCCGDRWSRQWDDNDGTPAPMIYDKKPIEYRDVFARVGDAYCHIYHLDGMKQTYRKGEDNHG